METLTPKDTIASGNEVLADFMYGPKCWTFCRGYKAVSIPTGENKGTITYFDEMDYKNSWDWLMPVWYKFRDLKFESATDMRKHRSFCSEIAMGILSDGISEAFKELVKGITWYNSIKS